jgi:hypothetical protein
MRKLRYREVVQVAQCLSNPENYWALDISDFTAIFFFFFFFFFWQ